MNRGGGRRVASEAAAVGLILPAVLDIVPVLVPLVVVWGRFGPYSFS
ncbi:hypothetical protein K1W54_22345 [Micromonospora sp. CPCC 205371]|nr:hypothetical protein [Micromonospora sp. CPCC 205371]